MSKRDSAAISIAVISAGGLKERMASSALLTRLLTRGFLAVAALTSTWAASGREEDSTLQEMPHDRDYELRVLYLEDPRLPTLEAKQRTELCGKVEHLLLAWFGYRAHLREVGQKNLPDYFAAHAGVFRNHADILEMELDTNREADRQRLKTVVRDALAPLRLAEIREQFHLGQLTSPEQAVTLAYDRFLGQLAEIRAIPLPHGGTFADPTRPELNSYMHWCAMDYEMEEADLVFTNSMVAGADLEMSPVIIARGGITTGITNANRHNEFGTAAMVGLFPFLSDAPFWLRERGPIPDAERLDVIATMTMHELGHMLLRRAHPTDHAANCVHCPPAGLRYYDWHLAIRKDGPCLLSHPKLTHY